MWGGMLFGDHQRQPRVAEDEQRPGGILVADLAAEVLAVPVHALGDVADGDRDMVDLVKRRGRIGKGQVAGGHRQALLGGVTVL